MAINPAQIKQEILNLLDSSAQLDPKLAKEDFATKLTSVIVSAITSATVTVLPGIPVATTGSAVAQTGITTASGTGQIS